MWHIDADLFQLQELYRLYLKRLNKQWAKSSLIPCACSAYRHITRRMSLLRPAHPLASSTPYRNNSLIRYRCQLHWAHTPLIPTKSSTGWLNMSPCDWKRQARLSTIMMNSFWLGGISWGIPNFWKERKITKWSAKHCRKEGHYIDWLFILQERINHSFTRRTNLWNTLLS